MGMSATPYFAEAIKTALYDPDWFCRHVLYSPNDKWQSEMMNALADLDRIKAGRATVFNHGGLNRLSVAACHGPGKTHIAAKMMHWWNFTRIGIIPCTAPKEKQVITRLFPEFRRVGKKAGKDYQRFYKCDTKKIMWAGNKEHVAMAESGQNSENIAGLHADNLFYIVDEASGVHEDMFPAVEGSLTTDDSAMFMIGNPTRTSGEFWASHKKKGTKELYYTKQISYKDSPRVSNKWAREMIRKYGIKSPVVQVRVFGLFPDAEDNQLITLEWIENARQAVLPFTNDNPKIRVSVDVADGGEDETCITVGFHYDDYIFIKRIRKFSFPSSLAPIMSADVAEQMFLAYGGNKASDEIIVDSLGVGAGTAGTLMKRGYNVVAHKGGSKSVEPDKYRNMRTQVYCEARDDFRDGYIIFDEDALDTPELWDEMAAQLCSIKSKPGNERMEEIMTKKEMKAKGFKSPDIGDSIVMQKSPNKNETIKVW